MKREVVRKLEAGILCLLMVFTLMMPLMAVKADSGDTTWQEDFRYGIEGENIVLSKYIGTAENLVISDKARIGGKEYKVKLDDSCGGFFQDNTTLKSVDFGNVSTSNVTNMDYMFYGCSNLSKLNVNKWDTSNVTSMVCMFYDCSSLEELDVSNWDTGNVSYMGDMFYHCGKLKKLDVSNWKVDKVHHLDSVFNGCSELTNLDVSNWNVSNAETMNHLFAGCSNLVTLDVSDWNTSSVTSMISVFNGCSKIKKLDVSRWDTSNVTTTTFMFSDCYSLSSLDLSNWEMSKLADSVTGMFFKCNSLDRIKTPLNLAQDIGLPATFVDEDNNTRYYDLPKGKTESLTLVREKQKTVVTPPKAKNYISYTGNPEELVISGHTSGGTLYYGIGVDEQTGPEDDAWSTNIPTATDLGTYYVWYKVVGNEYYRDVPAQYIGTPSTIIELGPESGNVILIDEEKGIAVVRDDVTDGVAEVSIEYIREGAVYRMYDPSRGEHFYTKNEAEMQSLIKAGWTHEADADFIVVDANDENAIPVYRVYNPNGGGMHFYTENAEEAKGLVASGWSYEGISHYVYKKTADIGTAQYRLYNPNSTNGEHNWTTDVDEWNMLKQAGWADEGICWRIK